MEGQGAEKWLCMVTLRHTERGCLFHHIAHITEGLVGGGGGGGVMGREEVCWEFRHFIYRAIYTAGCGQGENKWSDEWGDPLLWSDVHFFQVIIINSLIDKSVYELLVLL